MSKGVGMPDERIFFQYSAYPFNAAPLIKNEILPDVWVYNDFFNPVIWEEEKSDIVAKFPAFYGRLLNLFFPPANFRIANKLRISRITTKFLKTYLIGVKLGRPKSDRLVSVWTKPECFKGI